MKITLNNDAYISKAISNVTGETLSNISYCVDPEDNLIIKFPENVDISLVEAEIENVKEVVNLQKVRAERDRLIAETDWWVLPDRTPTEEQLAYRQALRDITDNYSSLDDVVWPEKPL